MAEAVRPAYTDEDAERYDRYRALPPESVEKYVANLVDLAGLRGGERILDGGAGTGRFAEALAKKFRVTAFDCSRDMIAQGLAKGRKVRWVQGDLAHAPFRRNSFDCTFLAYVVHQLPDYGAALEEMARLAPKCVVVTTDMYRRLPSLVDQAFPGIARIDRERFPPIEDLEGTFLTLGFRRVRARRVLLERAMSKEEYMDRVRNRFLSTFDLLGPGEYEAGVRKLEGLLASVPGNEIVNRVQVTFVAAADRK